MATGIYQGNKECSGNKRGSGVNEQTQLHGGVVTSKLSANFSTCMDHHCDSSGEWEWTGTNI